MNNRRQRTIDLRNTAVGRKVKLVSRMHTGQGQFRFWSVSIDGQVFQSDRLERWEAEDECFKRWLDDIEA